MPCFGKRKPATRVYSDYRWRKLRLNRNPIGPPRKPMKRGYVPEKEVKSDA